jgi:hypothetical protein
MRKFVFWAFVICCSFSALAVAQEFRASRHNPNVEDLNEENEPPILGVHWARDFRPARAARSSNPNMTYHGGRILTTVVSKAIWWGKSWANYNGDKITGIDTWYLGHDGSNYAKTVNEYAGTNGQVGSALTHQGHVIDASTASGGNLTSTILGEVCKQIATGTIVPDPHGNGYYPVYSDVKRGNAGYCAWHSAGTCVSGGANTAVQFAFFFNLDGDPGCDPVDTQTGHSQGLAALANVTAHEISEARSDPTWPGAWYDASGNENGDKCAWTFNVPYVSFPGGSLWKLQGEWSNKAYAAGNGYPNYYGQKGCLDGH